jgi:hypothetical protein
MAAMDSAAISPLIRVPDNPNLFKHLGGQQTIDDAPILDIVDEIESAKRQ